MPAKTFESWLRLLDVAWRALDPHARLTLNDLVRMSLDGQPLPEGGLGLEMLEDGTATAPTSLSGMLTGWSALDRNSTEDQGGLIATLTHCGKDGDGAVPKTPSTTTSIAGRAVGTGDAGRISQEGTIGDSGGGLFGELDDLDFDEYLSQEI
jgi:hypothetical protein